MRQYLLSGAVLGAIASGLGLLQKTLRSRFSLYVALLWASWLISLILAIVAVREKDQR